MNRILTRNQHFILIKIQGYSYSEDDTPVMCFNGPKSYQLGWYSQYHVDLPISGGFNWNGNLVGFAEKSSASWSDKMIVRIITATTDFYIHFNRMIGMNIGTLEGGDHVLVTSRSTGVDFAESTLEAMLSANTFYTIPNFNGGWTPLTISVTSITTTTVPGYATISIQYGESVPSASTPSIFQTSSVTTRSPMASPIISPTLLVTQLPIPSPTVMPILQTKSTEKTIATSHSNCNFNSICELGEDCNSCPFDCNGKESHFCCAGDSCDNIKCNINGWHCT